MDVVKLRKIARTLMALGSTGAILGVGIMVHGELNFAEQHSTDGNLGSHLGAISHRGSNLRILGKV